MADSTAGSDRRAPGGQKNAKREVEEEEAEAEAEAAWLAAGKREDVERMRALRLRHPRTLALDRVSDCTAYADKRRERGASLASAPCHDEERSSTEMAIDGALRCRWLRPT